jgi:hypothetical protein
VELESYVSKSNEKQFETEDESSDEESNIISQIYRKYIFNMNNAEEGVVENEFARKMDNWKRRVGIIALGDNGIKPRGLNLDHGTKAIIPTLLFQFSTFLAVILYYSFLSIVHIENIFSIYLRYNI